MGQEEAHLEERERVLARHQELGPHLARRRHHRRRGHRLVPRAGRGAARSRHRAGEHHQELERPRHLPAVQVAGSGVAPHVGGQRRPGARDLARHRLDARRGHAALALGELRRVGRIDLAERALEALELHRLARPLLAKVLLPVDPAPDELAIPRAVAEHHVRHREQHRRLGPGPRGEPVVGHRRGVGQSRVDDAHLGAGHLALDDALGVRVEVVAGLEVRGQQQHEARAAVVGRGPIGAVPERVAGAGGGRAHVGVAVVAVDAPRVEDPLEVDQLVAGAPEVVHDLFRPPLDERFADAAGDVVERLVPRHPLPLAVAALPGAAHRVQDPLGVGDLIQRRRALGAVAPAAAGVLGVALELLDAERLLVDVGEQAAPGLAVEADRRDQRVVALDLLRPGARVVLLPVVPARGRRKLREATLGGLEVAGNGMQRRASFSHLAGVPCAACAWLRPVLVRRGLASFAEGRPAGLPAAPDGAGVAGMGRAGRARLSHPPEGVARGDVTREVALAPPAARGVLPQGASASPAPRPSAPRGVGTRASSSR